jgi:YHS domain-containing protein
MLTSICPACGCSLVRLGIKPDQAQRHSHGGTEYLFCCPGCVDIFVQDPEKYLAEIRDLIVCPTCLAEKPLASTVSIEHEGRSIYFCRCPHCIEVFKREPDRFLKRLAA